MDEGTLGSDFHHVDTYLGTSSTHILTDTDNGITSGLIYTFKYVANNIVGNSTESQEVRYAAASPPLKPNDPTKDLSKSTKTSITVKWD